jgi:hypothetical protein
MRKLIVVVALALLMVVPCHAGTQDDYQNAIRQLIVLLQQKVVLLQKELKELQEKQVANPYLVFNVGNEYIEENDGIAVARLPKSNRTPATIYLKDADISKAACQVKVNGETLNIKPTRFIIGEFPLPIGFTAIDVSCRVGDKQVSGRFRAIVN